MGFENEGKQKSESKDESENEIAEERGVEQDDRFQREESDSGL